MIQAQSNRKALDFVVINTICFFAGGKASLLLLALSVALTRCCSATPSIACIDARYRLDMALLARVCNVGRRKIKLATERECREIFGFAPGTVAPFGHHPQENGDRIPVYVDCNIQDASSWIAGAGSTESCLWMSSAAFLSVIPVRQIAALCINTGASKDESQESAQAPADSDLTSSADQKVEYKFVADAMVSQVGRWLRAIGVDVVTWKPSQESDSVARDTKAELLAFAANEQRIVLTRDTQLASRRDAGACFVLSSDLCYKQFREVKTQFGLHKKADDDRTSRCAKCNATEFTPVDLEYVRLHAREEVYNKVVESVTNFWICVQCQKLYWEGPKYTTATATSSNGTTSVQYKPSATHRRIRRRRQSST